MNDHVNMAVEAFLKREGQIQVLLAGARSKTEGAMKYAVTKSKSKQMKGFGNRTYYTNRKGDWMLRGNYNLTTA